jgi:hypothetical protein
VRSIVLAILVEESAHGYEPKQARKQTFAPAYPSRPSCPSPDLGRIDVTRGRLEKDGLVRLQSAAQKEHSDTCADEHVPAGPEAGPGRLKRPQEALT